MAQKEQPTRRAQPLILVRGFGGLGVEDEKRAAYQGFNDGTVYPHKRGENYIYEGLILRFMKSDWRYQDATNVVNYYSRPVTVKSDLPEELKGFNLEYFVAPEPAAADTPVDPIYKIVIDPAMASSLLRTVEDPSRTLWVFRYYDLDERKFDSYGRALARLIDFIRDLAVKTGETEKPRVNILAHSMGGLIVREAVQRTYRERNQKAADYINKIVTLGTPHRGITFQILKYWMGDAAEEMERFNPDFQESRSLKNGQPNYASYHWFGDSFPPERLLTVVGTNYRSYAIGPSSWLNRVFAAGGEFGANYNRSDGLVKQISAQIPGAPRTFVHKCHSGVDSLVTARESYEIATRFFFGNIRASLRLVEATVTRGKDWFGKSEFFLGVGIKPRRVDFELFHQSAEAENCYGPFSRTNGDRAIDFSEAPDKLAFGWADDNKLIWQGWLDTSLIEKDERIQPKDMVLRLDFYVGERDLFGIGFSDNVIFRKQYYVRALLPGPSTPELRLFLHTGEDFALPNYDLERALEDAATPTTDGQSPVVQEMSKVPGWDGAWIFPVKGTGFSGTFQIEIDAVPEVGPPVPLKRSAPTTSEIPVPP